MPNASNHIVIIGAANADITGISTNPLQSGESNPGRMSLGAGGVGRNIADNFARLAKGSGIQAYLLSAVGDDVYGKMVIEQSQDAGINMSHCQTVTGAQTASYFCIVDSNGEMHSAINDMSIVEQINATYLQTKASLINSAKLIVLDANLTQQAIDYVCDNFNHIPIFFDSVSAAKADRITKHIGQIHAFTPNLNEAEILSGISQNTGDNLHQIAAYFHNKGLSQLYITMGGGGLYVSSMVDNVVTAAHLPARKGKIINSNGAGDSFMAGLIFAHLKDMTAQQQADFAQSCAFLNCQSKHTINRDLSRETVLKFMETL